MKSNVDLSFFYSIITFFQNSSEAPNFSSVYAKLQNTSQQGIPSCSIGELVSPPLFEEANDTMSQNLLQESKRA